MKISQLLFATLVGATVSLRAQSFDLSWFSIDGGGGTSAGGRFALDGSIGQADASSPLTGGAFSVTGGFQTLPQVIRPAPELTITLAGPAGVTISWVPSPVGFVLQMSDGISPATWNDVPSGFDNPITVPLGPGTKFFRLKKVDTF